MANFTYTLQNIYNTGYAIIKATENASAYARDTFILPKINTAQNKIIFGGLRNPITKETLDKVSLPFNNGNQFYSSVANITTSSDMATTDVTISVSDTTYFASSGKLWVDGDIISYTGKTATTFTGVTGIGFAHLSGSIVRQLFSLPTDFALLSRAWYKNKYILVSIDQRNIVNRTTQGQYSINPFSNDFSDIETNNEYYYSLIDSTYILPITNSENSAMIRLEYEKKPTQLVAASPSTQTLAIPDDFALDTIPYIAFGLAMVERGESDEGYKLLSIGYENVKAMYDYYGQTKSELMFDQRVRTSSDVSLNI